MKKRILPANWYYQSLKVDPLQRYWHKRRFAEVSELIEAPCRRILDVGCNDGTFSKVIFEKSRPKELIGIDVAEKSIAWANKHWGNRNLKFRLADAESLDFASNSFDLALCLEVLEHVVDPQKVLRGIKRVLKKGGSAILLVPSDNLLFRVIWFFWLHFYPRGWVWRETHIQSFRGNSLPEICQKVGFTIVEDKKFNLGMLHLVKVIK